MERASILKAGKSNYWFALSLRQVTRLWRFPQTPRERLARLFFRPNQQPPYPFHIRLDGVHYRGVFSEYLDWRIFFLGGFERETVNLCKFLSCHAAFPAFCDIGANRGLYSLLLAGLYARVVAFEPLDGNIRKLKSALDENGIDNVEILPLALGEADGQAPFYLPPEGNDGVGSFLPEHVQNSSRTEVIRIRQGDSILQERNVRPGLLKIDTEGYEWQVLRGLKATLERDRPFIVLEIGDSSKDAIRAGGGLHAALPPDYKMFEISDHTTAPEFFLKTLQPEDILNRPITNNLACPVEKAQALAPFIRD